MIGQYSQLEMMPYEILENVIANLSERDLAKMSRLNRRFYIYISNMPVWRELTRTKFANSYINHYLRLPTYTPFFRIYAVEMMFDRFENLSPYIESLDKKLDVAIGTGLWAVVVLAGPLVYEGIKKIQDITAPLLKKGGPGTIILASVIKTLINKEF